jgi:hypothetical protein
MRNYGLPLTEYCFKMELSKQVRCSSSENSSWLLYDIPFLNLITLNRNYDSNQIDYRINRLEKLLQNSAPIEFATGLFDVNNEDVTSLIRNFEYPLYLRDAIGQIFDVRKYDRFDANICFKGQQQIDNYKKINDSITNTLIWTSSSMKLYQRPYISNKHWGNIPKFRLIKAFPFVGTVKKINLNEENKSLLNTFPKNLFDIH